MSAGVPPFDLRMLELGVVEVPCVVRGPADGPQLVMVPPLFEEMNRTRWLLAELGRRLADAGVGSWLPDLPGTGDSPLPSEAADWGLWRGALAALGRHVGAAPHVLAVRGGALLADAVEGVSLYRLAPVDRGTRLLRELRRAQAVADREAGVAGGDAGGDAPVTLAGYTLSPALLGALEEAGAGAPRVPSRTAAVGGGTGDVLLEGPPLWRHAEPEAAPALAAALAEDVLAWIAACDSRC